MADEASAYGVGGAPSGLSEAAFSPMKLEAVRIVQMKDEFERLMKMLDFKQTNNRVLILRSANTFYNETYGVFLRDDLPPADLQRIHATLDAMEETSRRITQLTPPSGTWLDQNTRIAMLNQMATLPDEFERQCWTFLRQMAKALTDRNLGVKMKEKDFQVDRLRKIFRIPQGSRFTNPFGIPISPEMEMFCRLCCLRVDAGYDNIFIVEGDTGVGKSSFSWAAGSTIASMRSLTFSIKDNFIFNEGRQYVDKLIRTAPFGVPFVFDELGNQANSKTHWDIEQITLMNDWRLVRFVGLSVFGNWTSKDEIDKQFRTRILGMITIEERGTAHFRTYNKNRYTGQKEFIPYEIKNKVAYTAQEANDLIEEHDVFNHLDIPYFEIPEKLWLTDYVPEKTLAKTMRRAGASWLGQNAMSAAEHYATFMSQLPADTDRVTPLSLQRYANSVGYTLSFQQLVKKVAKDIGAKVNEIYVSANNPLDDWDGYMQVNDVIRSYSQRLRARLDGAKDAGL